MDFTEYLRLEALLATKLQEAWAVVSEDQLAPVLKHIKAQDWGAASEAVSQIDMSPVGEATKEMSSTVLRATIDFGARVAGGGTSLTSSLRFDSTVDTAVTQLNTAIEWNATLQMQKYGLQLIADAKRAAEEAADAMVLKKADPLHTLTSFKQAGDEILQLISSLHSNRLGSWGFLAEADLIGLTVYKLSAQLDNRTSAFCRFIDGKVFRVEDAKPVINQAVHAGDPNDLKTIQPWPSQSKAAMERYEKMTQAEMVDERLHAPPYHPGCRTIMVREHDVVKLKKPATIPMPDLPTKVATMGDFNAIGMKVTADQLQAWNDYVAVDPADLLSVLSGMPKVDFIDKTVSGTVKVSNEGKVNLAWQTEKDDLSAKGNLLFDGPEGSIKLTKLKMEEATPETVAAYLEYLRDSMLTMAASTGATSITMPVAAGEVLPMISLGWLPSQTQWNKIRSGMKKAVTNGSYKEQFESLDVDLQKTFLTLVDTSTVNALQVITDLDLPNALLYSLFSKLQFTGYMKI